MYLKSREAHVPKEQGSSCTRGAGELVYLRSRGAHAPKE